MSVDRDILCGNDLLPVRGALSGPDVEVLLQCRRVSREWRGALNNALPLLRRVSFPVGVTGEGVKRTLGLVAGVNLQVVGMALCRELSASDIEATMKLLHATCPGVREVDRGHCHRRRHELVVDGDRNSGEIEKG